MTPPQSFLRSLIAPRAGSHPPGAAGAVRAGPRAGCYPREHVPSTPRSSHPFRLVATAIALNGQSISKRGGRGGSGKGTQLPLITARQPALPQKASAAGEAPAAPLPGGRAAPPPFRAPTFQGIPPRRPAPRRGRPALSAASRSGARSPHVSRCAACNPISHFLVDSLKEAAVQEQNKGYCFISSSGFRVLTGMPLPMAFSLRLRLGVGDLVRFKVSKRQSRGRSEAFNKPVLWFPGPQCNVF